MVATCRPTCLHLIISGFINKIFLCTPNQVLITISQKYQYCQHSCHLKSYVYETYSTACLLKRIVAISLYDFYPKMNNCITVMKKKILTSLTDKNSKSGNTKCRSRKCAILVVKSQSAIFPGFDDKALLTNRQNNKKEGIVTIFEFKILTLIESYY